MPMACQGRRRRFTFDGRSTSRNAGCDSDPRRYLFLHLFFLHFWLFLQSLLLLHSTHLFFFLSQTSSPLQFLSLWQFFASATTSAAITSLANAESPTRPRALPAAAFSRPRRSADDPTTRASASNRLASMSSSV